MKHLGTKVLYGNHLILRRFKEDDSLEIFNGFVNQDEFLYYSNKKKRTLDEQVKSLIGIDEKYTRLDYYNWVITLNDKIIGAINAHINNDIAYINYGLDNRYFNNGYMSEALKLVLNYLLDEVKIKRIECGCVVENIASKKVMEKNNMIYGGVMVNEVLLADGYHDMYLYYLEGNDESLL